MGWVEVVLMVVKLFQRNRSGRGRPCKATNANYLEKIRYVLRTGIQWSQITGPLHWSTYYKKFRQWSRWGVFQMSFEIVQKIIKRMGYLRGSSYANLYIDSTMIKNVKGAEGVGVNHYDRGRNGSKMTIVVTREGIPLGLKLSGSNVHDVHLVEPLIANLSVKIVGSNLVGDKGYISRGLKSRLSVAGINLVYPMRVNQRDVNSSEERALLRVRNIVENVFSWQQLNRRIRLRYEVSSCSLSSFYYLGLLVLINRKIDF